MTRLVGDNSAISATTTIAGLPRQTRRPGLRIFVVGHPLWVASLLSILHHQQFRVIPTIIWLGGFVVPFTGCGGC